MIKTLFTSLFAVFLFALGAVGAWYFVQFQQQKAQQQTKAQQLADEQTMNVSAVDRNSDQNSETATKPPASSVPMPAAVQNRTMSAEEQFRMGVLYKDQIEEIKRREEALRDQEARLHLGKQDLKQQKLEVEGVLEQIKTYVAQAETLLATVQDERKQLEAEKQQRDEQLKELKNARSVPNEIEKKNVKKMADLLGGMNETAAAKILKALANEGNMSYALRLLDSVEQRDASKILDALADPGLQAEFTEAYRQLPREQETNRR